MKSKIFFSLFSILMLIFALVSCSNSSEDSAMASKEEVSTTVSDAISTSSKETITTTTTEPTTTTTTESTTTTTTTTATTTATTTTTTTASTTVETTTESTTMAPYETTIAPSTTVITSAVEKGFFDNIKGFFVGDESGEEEIEDELVEKDYLRAESSVTYHSSYDENWNYVTHQKKFPASEECYVRIATTAITEGGYINWNKGVGDEIKVVYTLTGLDICGVELFENEGVEVRLLKSDDPNVLIFTKRITAEKSENALDNLIILRYKPRKVGKVTLKINYDDQLAQKFDYENSVEFVRELE